MSDNILQLKPEGLWKEFNNILGVPRPSKKEAKMVAYLEKWAKDHNVDYTKEDCGNIIMRVPATKGMEDRETVILQAHMDMVCDKLPEINHNFEQDPIKVRIENGCVKTHGTTLGADNGIGMSAALAVIADPKVEHGPLECIFTVDEETGLNGAYNLDLKDVTGRILLNLDTEDESEIYIGCAGGMTTNIMFFHKMTGTKEGYSAFKISINGLHGGHSGVEINNGYTNAIKLLAEILDDLKGYLDDMSLYDIQGGSQHNAIPKQASAVICIPNNCINDLLFFFDDLEESLKEKFGDKEPNLKVKIEATKRPDVVLTEESHLKLIHGLLKCENGVIKMSDELEDLVETSSNLALIMKKEGHFFIQTSQRSCIARELRKACFTMKYLWEELGAEVEHTGQYPGWAPNPNSPILDIAVNCYKKRFKKDPKVRCIHAGLECGVISDKFPGMDMISFGPTIRGEHTPDECCEIATVQMFWDFMCDILKNVPKTPK